MPMNRLTKTVAQNLARSLSVAPLAFLRIAERFFLPHYELVTRRVAGGPEHGFAAPFRVPARGVGRPPRAAEHRDSPSLPFRASRRHAPSRRARAIRTPGAYHRGRPDTSEGAVELPCRILVPGPHSRAIVAHARWV